MSNIVQLQNQIFCPIFYLVLQTNVCSIIVYKIILTIITHIFPNSFNFILSSACDCCLIRKRSRKLKYWASLCIEEFSKIQISMNKPTCVIFQVMVYMYLKEIMQKLSGVFVLYSPAAEKQKRLEPGSRLQPRLFLCSVQVNSNTSRMTLYSVQNNPHRV